MNVSDQRPEPADPPSEDQGATMAPSDEVSGQPSSAEGASAPEPALAARIARSGARAAFGDDAGRRAFRGGEIGPNENAANELVEGPPGPAIGRVDAADASLGRHRFEPASGHLSDVSGPDAAPADDGDLATEEGESAGADRAPSALRDRER